MVKNPDGSFGHIIKLKPINGIDAEIHIDLTHNLKDGPIRYKDFKSHEIKEVKAKNLYTLTGLSSAE